MLLSACADYLTGQDPEPPGPLLVTRLTLLDPGDVNGLGDNSSGLSVFTDTSSPLDCMLPALANTSACTSTPFKDMYSPMFSPPDPDSSMVLRVVFNKVPLLLNGQQLESTPAMGLPSSVNDLTLIDPTVVQLQCEGAGCAVPPSYNSLQVQGSDLSPIPPLFNYGPALQMQVFTQNNTNNNAPLLPGYLMGAPLLAPGTITNIPDDPLRALEPGTTYNVTVNPGLSDRNNNLVQLDSAAMSLLNFQTEPFHVTRVGVGDPSDPFVTNTCLQGTGVAGTPYMAMGVTGMMPCAFLNPYNDGVLAVYVNAGIDPSVLQTTTASATIALNGNAAMPVAVKPYVCPGLNPNQRVLYVAPTAGTWDSTLQMTDMAVVTVTLHGSDIRDVTQAAGHPAGQGLHVLPSDVVMQTTIQYGSTPTMTAMMTPNPTITASQVQNSMTCN
jgi:hypothetical protein